MIPAKNFGEALQIVSNYLKPEALGYILPTASVHVPVVSHSFQENAKKL